MSEPVAMSTTIARRCRGMTLVELLVVIAILGLLSVAVLPSISDTTDARRFREAARGISSFIARAQSRAINAAGSRGFMVQPLPAQPGAGVDLQFVNAPPPFGGVAQHSLVSVVMPPVIPTAQPLFCALNFSDETATKLASDRSFASGDAIQFGGLGAYYLLEVDRNNPPEHRIRMWGDISQNLVNTTWPQTPPGGTPFRILRQPRRATSGGYQVQRGAAVDIGWSCLGTTPLKTLIDPASAVAAVALLFDTAGRPQEIVHSGGQRIRISAPLFLLVGASQLAGNDYAASAAQESGEAEDRTGANWQHPDSVWLCIDNNTGVVKFGTVKPGAANVLDSQWYIRQTVGMGVSE